MTQNEFIKKVVGLPWVNRAISFDAVDCYGLVVLYYRHVLGVELPIPEGFNEKLKTDECWNNGISDWEQVSSPNTGGLMFTCYKGGSPCHVGVTISPTHVLHCRGSERNPGKVEVHSVRTIESIYGKITYHKFIG